MCGKNEKTARDLAESEAPETAAEPLEAKEAGEQAGEPSKPGTGEQTGSWVDIDQDGNVTVDGELLDEPYVTNKSLGDCNITLPYQVPDDRIFVMGDHRETSVDSRNTAVGCISGELVVGKILFRIWPLSSIGGIT